MVTQGQIGLQIIARVGSLFFLETQDSVKKIVLNDVSYAGNKIQGNLVNQSNANALVTCLYHIIDSDGVPVDRGKSSIYYMDEQGAVDFSVGLSDDLTAGSYIAVLTFDLEDGISSVQEFEFSVN